MSFQSHQGAGHTEGTEPFRWLRSQEDPDTRRSHLYPVESGDATHTHSRDLPSLGAGLPRGGNGTTRHDVFRGLGDGGCAVCIRHLYQFLMKDAIDSTQAGQSHVGRKSQVLGRKVMCLQRPWQSRRSKVMYWQRSCLLWYLTYCSPTLLGRSIVNAID